MKMISEEEGFLQQYDQIHLNYKNDKCRERNLFRPGLICSFLFGLTWNVEDVKMTIRM